MYCNIFINYEHSLNIYIYIYLHIFCTLTLCLLKKEKHSTALLAFLCPPKKNTHYFHLVPSTHAFRRCPDARGFVHVAKCSTAPTRGADGSWFAGGGNSKILWWKLNQKRYPQFGGGLLKKMSGWWFFDVFYFHP